MAILEFENGARGMLMGTTISNVPEEALKVIDCE